MCVHDLTEKGRYECNAGNCWSRVLLLTAKKTWKDLSGEHRLLCMIFQNVGFSSKYLKTIILLF